MSWNFQFFLFIYSNCDEQNRPGKNQPGSLDVQSGKEHSDEGGMEIGMMIHRDPAESQIVYLTQSKTRRVLS